MRTIIPNTDAIRKLLILQCVDTLLCISKIYIDDFYQSVERIKVAEFSSNNNIFLHGGANVNIFGRLQLRVRFGHITMAIRT